jgi:hypothetical protein
VRADVTRTGVAVGFARITTGGEPSPTVGGTVGVAVGATGPLVASGTGEGDGGGATITLLVVGWLADG